MDLNLLYLVAMYLHFQKYFMQNCHCIYNRFFIKLERIYTEGLKSAIRNSYHDNKLNIKICIFFCANSGFNYWHMLC